MGVEAERGDDRRKDDRRRARPQPRGKTTSGTLGRISCQSPRRSSGPQTAAVPTSWYAPRPKRICSPTLCVHDRSPRGPRKPRRIFPEPKEFSLRGCRGPPLCPSTVFAKRTPQARPHGQASRTRQALCLVLFCPNFVPSFKNILVYLSRILARVTT